MGSREHRVTTTPEDDVGLLELASQLRSLNNQIAQITTYIINAQNRGIYDLETLKRLDAERQQLMAAYRTVEAEYEALKAAQAARTAVQTAEAAEAGGAGAASGGIVSRTLTGLGRLVLRILGRKGVISAGTALGVGAVTAAVAAGAITYVAANQLGGASADKPIALGPRGLNGPTTLVTAPPPPQNASALSGLYPDISGAWHETAYGHTANFSQSGGTFSGTSEYEWGGGLRRESTSGTVTKLVGGSARIEMDVAYTEFDGKSSKGHYSGNVSVDASGRATSISWSNNDRYIRKP